MSSDSSKPSRINSQPPHTPQNEKAQEKWKSSPSTETNSDQGENARVERERKVDENAPGLAPRKR
jgi:hypothetical protein